MRAIKFRAWHKSEKRWIYQFDIYRFSQIVEADGSSGFKIPLDIGGDVEIVQFTGLRDKNGKEIYEGDVISGAQRCEVIFENAIFWAKDAGVALYLLAPTWEVIGNIHENPEPGSPLAL